MTPRSSGGTNTAIKIFLRLRDLLVISSPHQNVYQVSFSKSSAHFFFFAFYVICSVHLCDRVTEIIIQGGFFTVVIGP